MLRSHGTKTHRNTACPVSCPGLASPSMLHCGCCHMPHRIACQAHINGTLPAIAAAQRQRLPGALFDRACDRSRGESDWAVHPLTLNCSVGMLHRGILNQQETVANLTLTLSSTVDASLTVVVTLSTRKITLTPLLHLVSRPRPPRSTASCCGPP